MKKIASIQGFCVLRYSPDDAASPHGVLVHEILSFLGENYNFLVKPHLSNNPAQSFDSTFQGGEIFLEDKKFAIMQLTYIPGGYIITAKDTDIAEMIADHVAEVVDSQFGLRISQNVREKYYTSDLVAEFDPALERQMAVIGRIKGVLEREIPRAQYPFDLKRLTFGAPDYEIQSISMLDNLPLQDFILERRANEPHSMNRYYSRAPLKTAEHERVLNLIEEAMRD